MPKLNVKDRKKVHKANTVSGEFEPWPAGKYLGTLSEVEVRESRAGNPMWNITYTDCRNMSDEELPGRQWYTLMLPQDTMPEDYEPKPAALKRAGGDVAAAWENYQEFVAGKIKAWFEAHGYTEDTDTDEMLGSQAVLNIGITTIQQGAKAGQKTNTVNSVSSAEDVELGSGSDDDEF
jgi:hypothetical protein